jgi:hypothetical protein
MPLTAPNIKCTITPDGTCAGMTFEDTTGQYDAVTKPLGWGLPGGPTSNEVENFTITLVNESTSVELLYSFTVVTGTITAATLTIDSTVTNILAELASTTFPFASANTFDLFGDYGADTPDMENGVYRVYYNLTGTSGSGVDFDYTVQNSVLADCEVCCCITKLFQSIDPDCGCNDKTWIKAMRAFAYMKAAQFTTEAGGNVERAVANLEMASNICDGTNCGCS